MKNYFKILTTLATGLCFFQLVSFAQPPAPPTPFKDRIFFGGNFGGQLYSYGGGFIDISPVVGYRVTPKFSAGTGPIYQYFGDPGGSTNNYGGKVFVRYQVWQSLFVHTEYDLVSEKAYWIDNQRRLVGSFLVGGGLSQRLGEASSAHIMALYNINQSRYSPYPSPLILSMGFGFGL